jgi:hypothetical protein
MYLVELISGKEAIYRTADEFDDAIRRGEVTTQSRIYHRAASTWISVTFHPQFRKVSAEQAEQSARFAEPLPLGDWTYLRTELSTASSIGEVAAPGAHEGAPESAAPQSEAGAESAAPLLQARSWRKMLSKLVRHA